MSVFLDSFWTRSQKTVTHIPNLTYHLFLYSPQVRMGFYMFYWLKNRLEEEKYFVIWKLHEIQIPVFVSKVLLWHHAHLLTVYDGCFHRTVPELNSCHREHMACRASNAYHQALYQRSLPTSELEQKFIINSDCSWSRKDWILVCLFKNFL